MPTVADFDKALHREIGAFRFDPLGFVMFAFPWGMPHTPLAQESGPEEWQREVLVRLGNGLLGGRCGRRRSRARRHRLGPRHRQVGAGRLDHPVGAVDPAGFARRGQRQHRGPAPHQDLARARQVARHEPQQGVVHLLRARRCTRPSPATRRPGGSMPSPGPSRTPRPSPACTTRAAAPSPCSTRRRPSPMRCGTPSRAR